MLAHIREQMSKTCQILRMTWSLKQLSDSNIVRSTLAIASAIASLQEKTILCLPICHNRWDQQQVLTLNCASRSACPSIISTSSWTRSTGAFCSNKLKLLKKSMNILNSAPVTSCKLWNNNSQSTSLKYIKNTNG